MAKQYYTLFTKDDSKWFPQFGDYSRRVVMEEMADTYDQDECKIVKHDDTREGLEQAQASLNK